MWYLIVYINWLSNDVLCYVQRSPVSNDIYGHTKLVYSFEKKSDAVAAKKAVMEKNAGKDNHDEK